MAQLSFTLCGIAYGGLLSASGKYAKGWQAAPVEQYIRWHLAGTDGSYTCDLGLLGWMIMARVRYVSTTPYADVFGDSNSFRTANGSIIGPDGHTYTRCKLDPNAVKIARDSIAMGRNIAGQQFMDITYAFTSDGG